MYKIICRHAQYFLFNLLPIPLSMLSMLVMLSPITTINFSENSHPAIQILGGFDLAQFDAQSVVVLLTPVFLLNVHFRESEYGKRILGVITVLCGFIVCYLTGVFTGYEIGVQAFLGTVTSLNQKYLVYFWAIPISVLIEAVSVLVMPLVHPIYSRILETDEENTSLE